MATNYTSNHLSLFLAEQFTESFYEPEPTSIGYVFIGKHDNYINEPTIEDISETPSSERQVWRNMIAAKKITGNDKNVVLLRKTWVSGTVYTQYDDQDLLTTSDNFYVVSSVIISGQAFFRIYTCLYNNNEVPSTVRPTAEGTNTNGIIETADGYIWKYMFAIVQTNKFVTTSYIPVPLNFFAGNSTVYKVTTGNFVDGGLYNIKIVNGGTGYTNTVATPQSTASLTDTLTFNNRTGIVVGMAVSGNGIDTSGDGTYVTQLISTNQVKLSRNTTAIIPSSGNDLTFSTRIVIVGDGTGAKVSSYTLNATTGAITGVGVSPYGTNYNYANVTAYGKGSSASLRAIIGPKYGHGSFPAEELAANTVMIATNIGTGDSTEGGLISASTKFRQIGFLRDPHKYGNTKPTNSFTSNSVVSMTHNVVVVPGNDYTVNEMVYQGTTLADFTFKGRVYDQDPATNTIKLTQVEGNFTTGLALRGNDSLVTRISLRINYPELQPYSGDILYTENTATVQRVSGQSENIRFVINF